MLIVHDYFTQRGGAERVAMEMSRELSGSRVLTAFYEPRTTFSELARMDVRTLPINAVGPLRRDPRRAFPFLAQMFSRVHLDEPVVVCSTTGWAHGVKVSGHKIVYCNNPARWLYQTDQYLSDQPFPVRAAVRALRPALRRWDHGAATGPRTTYLANSRPVAARIRAAYGIEAEVLHCPVTIDPEAEQEPIDGLEPGYLVTVGRPRGYKRTDAVIAAMEELPDHRLVVVGSDLEAAAPALGRQVVHLPRLSDQQLRWVYANSRALLAVADEDFGLTPLEANSFGRPVVALRAGGYLDTVTEGLNGVFVDDRRTGTIADGVRRCLALTTDRTEIRRHAGRFSLDAFCDRIRAIAAAGAV